MKTLTNFLSSIYKFQSTTLCLRRFYSDYLSFLLSCWDHAVTTLTKKLKTSKMKRVLLIFQAGRTAAIEAWSNKRFRVGVCVGMVALPAWKCYLFFDINTEIDGFYYVNYVFFLYQIRWQLAFTFISLGGFIAVPTKVGFRWVSLPIFLFCTTEIYQISTYDHWTDFYNGMPVWQVLVIISAVGVAIHFSINYLLYRKYHLKDGNIARTHGIIKAPNIPAEKKMDILEQLVTESENFNARI